MAIRWFCDFCEKEIQDDPVRLALYTEGVNRDLTGYGEPNYLIRQVGHKACVTKIKQEIDDLLNS